MNHATVVLSGVAMKNIIEEPKCSIGPSDLFPETKQCLNKPTKYLKGPYAERSSKAKPYCEYCYNKMIEALASYQ